MLRTLSKQFFNEEFGVFRCIAHKERILSDLFRPWTGKHPEFKYDYVIMINEDVSSLFLIITDEEDKLKAFREEYDSKGSSGNY